MLARFWRWLVGDPYPVARTGIVNLKSGSAFRGVIWQRRDGYLVLKSAELLKPRGEATPVDGETLIPEDLVEFIQLPRGVS